MLLDLINGCFEFLAGIAVWNHVHTLSRDKNIAGVSIGSTAFFFTWGIWNLVYYHGIQQYISWFAGVSVMLGNCAWLGLMLYYRKHPGGRDG